ncbi:hypothetical protein C2G38_2055832 [Gigaspora rosea]|uniref:Uncharacterized protein n=1 Tax=Gigaspora rosea TaxID=44941 RepID=A0A397W4X9_9GLOM|nr:hypothetical protein C2G38_2055832 [Gigaspora rosea]
MIKLKFTRNLRAVSCLISRKFSKSSSAYIFVTLLHILNASINFFFNDSSMSSLGSIPSNFARSMIASFVRL